MKGGRKEDPLLYLPCNRHSMNISWLGKYYQEPQCIFIKVQTNAWHVIGSQRMTSEWIIIFPATQMTFEECNGKTLDYFLRAGSLCFEHVFLVSLRIFHNITRNLGWNFFPLWKEAFSFRILNSWTMVIKLLCLSFFTYKRD